VFLGRRLPPPFLDEKGAVLDGGSFLRFTRRLLFGFTFSGFLGLSFTLLGPPLLFGLAFGALFGFTSVVDFRFLRSLFNFAGIDICSGNVIRLRLCTPGRHEERHRCCRRHSLQIAPHQ
jgi:hypothetical protein